MELLKLRVLTLGPVVHLCTECHCLSQGLLEDLILVDSDQEGELAGSPNRCYIELGREVFLLAANFNQQLLHLVKDVLTVCVATFMLSRLADKGLLCRLKADHRRRWVPFDLIIHKHVDFLRIKVEENEEFAGQEALDLL